MFKPGFDFTIELIINLFVMEDFWDAWWRKLTGLNPLFMVICACSKLRPFSKPRLRLWIRLEAPFTRPKPSAHYVKDAQDVKTTGTAGPS